MRRSIHSTTTKQQSVQNTAVPPAKTKRQTHLRSKTTERQTDMIETRRDGTLHTRHLFLTTSPLFHTTSPPRGACNITLNSSVTFFCLESPNTLYISIHLFRRSGNQDTQLASSSLGKSSHTKQPSRLYVFFVLPTQPPDVSLQV